jgi:hypothetical protein
MDDDKDVRVTKDYRLVNDITINSPWAPIDIFSGNLKGNGKTITFASDVNKGLFGEIGYASVKDLTIFKKNPLTISTGGALAESKLMGTIDNITVEIENININPISNFNVGGIVGENEGTITNSRYIGNLTVTVAGTWATVGGIVGNNSGTISGSYHRGDVSATSTESSVGGIAGSNRNQGKISGNYHRGDVSATSSINPSEAGGIVGHNGNQGEISGNYHSGNVSATSTNPSPVLSYVYAGGIAGVNDNQGKILDNVVLTGTLTSDAFKSSIHRIVARNNVSATSTNNWAFDITKNYTGSSPVPTGDDGTDFDSSEGQSAWAAIAPSWTFNIPWVWDSIYNRPSF